MFGSILDRLFVAISNRNGKLPLYVENYTYKNENANSNWVCFIPEFCYRIPFIRKRLTPDGINEEAYILPKTVIQPDPNLTRIFLDNVLGKAIRKQNQSYLERKVNVLGISLGNVLAFRFAENFQVNKLISVVPGSRLAECIWESIATNKLAQNSGINLREYQASLASYNPIESISRISHTYQEIHLGVYDLMIPYRRGMELAKKIQKKFRTSLYCNRFSGHVETIVSFSKRFPEITRSV